MSDQLVLSASPRGDLGSSVSRRTRLEGLIPAVIYGYGFESTEALQVNAREFRAIFSGVAGINALVELSLGGRTHLVKAQEVQTHPTRLTVQHVDFLALAADQPVEVDVNLVIPGLEEGGPVELYESTITVSALPSRIPTEIEISLESLVDSEGMEAGSLKLPAGVTLVSDELMVVAGPVRVYEMPAEPEADATGAEEDAGTDAEASGEVDSDSSADDSGE